MENWCPVCGHDIQYTPEVKERARVLYKKLEQTELKSKITIAEMQRAVAWQLHKCVKKRYSKKPYNWLEGGSTIFKGPPDIDGHTLRQILEGRRGTFIKLSGYYYDDHHTADEESD